MGITLRASAPRQKLFGLMSQSFWPNFWLCPTSIPCIRSRPPPWVSLWELQNQNKSCLAWCPDHFDIIFDRVQPQPLGHGVGLLRGYHSDRFRTKTKVGQHDLLIMKMHLHFWIPKVQPNVLVHSEKSTFFLSIWERIDNPKSCSY